MISSNTITIPSLTLKESSIINPSPASLADESVPFKTITPSSSSYSKLRKERYQTFENGKGKDFENGKLELKDLYSIAKESGEISPESGKQELFENIINQYI